MEHEPQPDRESSKEKFDATKLVHEKLLGQTFIDGAALGAALGYARLPRFWKRIERAEARGLLGYVMWRRDERGRIVECLLCDFSAMRIAVRTRSRTATAVSCGLSELMSCGRREELKALKQHGEARAELEAMSADIKHQIARADEHMRRLEERFTQKKLEIEAAHANTLPPAHEPPHEVAALRTRLSQIAEAQPSDQRARLYAEDLDKWGPAGRTWWRKDGARRIAYAAQLRRLLTTYHCPLRAMKSQVFAELCDSFSWGGKERPWRLLPASWVWIVNLEIDGHIAESLKRLNAARDKREQRHSA
jgi:uncharacterized coiled-coil protein SlyX